MPLIHSHRMSQYFRATGGEEATKAQKPRKFTRLGAQKVLSNANLHFPLMKSLEIILKMKHLETVLNISRDLPAVFMID